MSNSSIQERNDGTVRLSGEMNFATTPGLYRELEGRFKGDDPVSTIDLAGIRHADSSGLALLLEWQAMANQQHQVLQITNAPEQLLRMARLCEADKLLDISVRDHASG